MVKRRTRSRINSSSMKQGGKKALATVAGLAVGTGINVFLKKRIDTMPAYVSPLILAAVGLGGFAYAQDDILKQASLGIAAAGGADALNQLVNKPIVSLAGSDNIPLPGIGSAEYYQLPDNNEILTDYNPKLPPIGSVYEDGQTYVNEDGEEFVYVDDAAMPQSIEGVEEAVIV